MAKKLNNIHNSFTECFKWLQQKVFASKMGNNINEDCDTLRCIDIEQRQIQ